MREKVKQKHFPTTFQCVFILAEYFNPLNYPFYTDKSVREKLHINQSYFEVDQHPTDDVVPRELKDVVVTAQRRKRIFL